MKMPLSTAALLSAATRTLPRRCMTSAIICMTGDAIAQHSFEHKPLVKHDFVRSAHLGIYGGIIFAPIMNQWFSILNRIKHSNLVIQTAARVGVDQLIGAPCIPALFYASLTLLEGGNLDQVQSKIKAAWWPTLKVGWCVFTPASIINQSIVPPQTRVLFINSIALCWNVFLSYTNNKYKQSANLLSEVDVKEKV